MITPTQILDYMVSQKIPYVPCITLADLNIYLTSLGRPTVDESDITTARQIYIERVNRLAKIPKINSAVEKINRAPISINGKTFDIDPESQDNITRSISIFEALEADCISKGYEGMQWILSDNTRITVTKAELISVYEAAGIRKTQTVIAGRMAKDFITANQSIPTEILQILNIDENCNPV
jgi:hypothetical protein